MTATPIHLSSIRAIPMIALSTLIMAYGWRYNVIPNLVFLGIWYVHALYGRRFVLKPTPDLIAVFLLPSMALYSGLWSAYMGQTVYQGAEFVLMAGAVVLMSRLVRIDDLIKGLVAGCFIVLMLSLLNGSYAKDTLGTGAALIGLFTSKNQVGLFAEIGIVMSVLVLFLRSPWLERLAYTIPTLVACLIALYLCKSASSTLSLVATLAVLIGVVVVTRAERAFRPAIILAGLFALLTLGVLAVAFQFDAQTAVLESMGKNPTLTGRTYLWAEGLKVGLERPLLGHGYTAFWVHGQPQAEQYWEEFYILTRMGFHFHSMYIQTFVDLGLLGLAILAGIMLYTVGKSLFLALWHGLNAEYAFAITIGTMFLVRSFVEVDILGPFGIGAMLFYAILPRLAQMSRVNPATAANPVSSS